MTMKRIMLIIGVVIVFIAYSFIIRHHRSGSVIAPPSLNNSNNSTQSGSSTNSNGSSSSTTTPSTSTTYKDGTYTGSVQNAYYGNVEVSATISGGKITAVNFLEYPNDNPNSQYINQTATPYLKQEAIKAQNANVSIITGATLTSQAFIQSLSTALSKAS